MIEITKKEMITFLEDKLSDLYQANNRDIENSNFSNPSWYKEEIAKNDGEYQKGLSILRKIEELLGEDDE